MSVLNYSEVAGGVVISGASFRADISPAIEDITVEMSVDQVTELSITMDDPGFDILRHSGLPLDANVGYGDLVLSIAAIETDEGAGEGVTIIRARPRLVRSLKQRRGAHVMNNISPTQYIAQETAAVGGWAMVQDSPARGTISRDVTVVGQQGNDESSAWSTFKRLAGELGMVCFEVAGTIYVGKPSWFVSVMPRVRVTYGLNNEPQWNSTSIPKCSKSLDNDGRSTVTVNVPIERAGDFRPGNVLELRGIPTFDGDYFITDVSFSIIGNAAEEVTVTAETPYDPEPTPVQEDKTEPTPKPATTKKKGTK